MSQNIWDTINPAVTSGNQLATLLNDLKDALMTGQSGTARPSQTQAGGYWVNNSVADTLTYTMYDGSQDRPIFSVNTSTGKVSIGGSDSQFEISKISDDTVGPILKFLKKRATGNGQTLDNDILGQADFFGTQDDSNESVQARIQVVSTDDVTALAQGSDILISTTEDNTPTLSEKIRIKGSGRVGLGLTLPERKIHARGGASHKGIMSESYGDIADGGDMSVKKQRVLDGGQVKNLDTIGTYNFLSTDQNGLEVVAAKIVATAVEDHSDVAHGTNLSIFTKKDGTTTFQEAIKIENGTVSILGIQTGTDIKENKLLEDKAATRNLFSIDGSIYSSFEISANFIGRDNVETRAQLYKIKGIYDSVNTEWYVEYSDSVVKNGVLINLDIPSFAVQNLVVDYLNQFNDVNFVDGKIHLDIRRTLA